MKLRFREKTYIITLCLFLLFLNTGVFSLAFYTYTRNTDASEKICYAEERVIADAFSNDINELGARNALALMQTYGEFYAEKDIYVTFSMGGNTMYSNLPTNIILPENGISSTQRLNGMRYFLISESLGQYDFTYAKDVSFLDEDFKHISVVFILSSLGASALLAVSLFFVLRKLSSPLESLREATARIASGELSTRADCSGSDEFSMLANDFNVMAEQVERQIAQLGQAAKQKQEMLDGLAHEMRTPLTSIRGYAEFLRDANISDEEKLESIEYIITESKRLKSISEKLLDDAFIRENGIKTEKNELSALINDAVRALMPKAKALRISLVAETVTAVIECDAVLISLLVTNLIDNAIKACGENGRVSAGCRENGDRTEIYISDNGIGMSKEQISHITEPFYRTDRSRSRSAGGTGLGLSLCKRIAQAHNAVLEFDSEPSKGTTARLIFYKSITHSEHFQNTCGVNSLHRKEECL